MLFNNIEAERARRGMTQADLAKSIGITESTFRNWISGRTDIPCSKLCAMADLFECSVDYLIGRTLKQ